MQEQRSAPCRRPVHHVRALRQPEELAGAELPYSQRGFRDVRQNHRRRSFRRFQNILVSCQVGVRIVRVKRTVIFLGATKTCR